MKEGKDILICTCPHCHAELRIAKAQKAGRFKYECRNCGKAFAVSFPPSESRSEASSDNEPVPTKPVKAEADRKSLAIGGLIEKKKGLFRKPALYPLKAGLQYIGRKDALIFSDIMLNDPAVSRRSVSVNVIKASDNDVPQYLLKVLKAKNPVLVNGSPVKEGESVYLSIGASLVLGKTRLILQ